MGAVYMMNFPSGEFYIGHTIKPLRSRITEHLSDPVNKNKMGLIDKFKLRTIDALMSITSIIYCGEDSKDMEKAILSDNKHSELCLNKIFPIHRPKLKSNICRISIKQKPIS